MDTQAFSPTSAQTVLSIRDLQVSFRQQERITHAVQGISLDLTQGEMLCLVGESGSGKSVTAMSVLRLLESPPAFITGGQILFKGQSSKQQDLLQIPESQLRQIRGRHIAMIFQDPMSSLNPVMTCGYQVCEGMRLHLNMTASQAKEKAHQLFKQVRLPDPDRIFRSYPHQLSGGQLQRVMIAMALSCDPEILIADEPTTALDVTVQKTILDLIQELRLSRNMTVLFITHDLGVVRQIADRIAVMYKGRIVETGPASSVLQNPAHPYSEALIRCAPELRSKLLRLPVVSDFVEIVPDPFSGYLFQPVDKGGERNILEPESEDSLNTRKKSLESGDTLIAVDQLKVYYPGQKSWFGKSTSFVKALDDVSFTVKKGETLGIVGESGSGKSTLGRAILRLQPVFDGRISYQGQEIQALSQQDFLPYRKKIQLVFQNPFASLNPRMTVGDAILEPMTVHKLHGNKKNRKEKVMSLLEIIGLQGEMYYRYPHEFSGGQRQRIAIARALAVEPECLVCDEAVSALDVSVQAQVLNLLADLRSQFDLTYLFITHDMSVVRFICDRVLVLQNGKLIESGWADDVIDRPAQEYTQRLIEAVPSKR